MCGNLDLFSRVSNDLKLGFDLKTILYSTFLNIFLNFGDSAGIHGNDTVGRAL